MQGNQADLEILALEGAALGRSPLNAVFCYGDFNIGAIGDLLEEIEELADCKRRTRLVKRRLGLESDKNVLSFEDFALANEDRTERLWRTSSTSSCDFLYVRKKCQHFILVILHV